jgi:hypothetical protein
MKQHGHESHLSLDEITIDKETISRKTGMPTDIDYVSDISIFQMLGARSVRALDHSDYEGAEVVHDLTKPLPDKLKGIADFIVDGSTLDNTFSAALTIRNYAELLRPGGRILMVNMWSNHHEPYTLQPPLWYLDYFTVNKFVDCKVYVLLFASDAAHTSTASNAFCINLDCLLDPARQVSSFEAHHDYEMATLVFAEKGQDSTADVSPAQQHYRSEADRKLYRDNLTVIRDNPRPHLIRSRSPIFFLNARGGHLFMNGNFEAVDPTSEAIRTRGLTQTVLKSKSPESVISTYIRSRLGLKKRA